MRNTFSLIGILALLAFGIEPLYAAEFTFGSAVEINDESTSFQAIASPDSTHIIAVYSDDGTGKAVIGTTNGETISLGTPATFEASSVTHLDVTMLDSTHAVIVYQTSTTAKAVLATIAGTSISYGTAVTLDTNIATSGVFPRIAITQLNSTHFAVTYGKSTTTGMTTTRDQRLAVGEVSGTTITFGETTSIYRANRSPYNAITALDATNFAVVYHTNTGVGNVIIGTVSGTAISTGSALQFVDEGSNTKMALIDSTHFLLVTRVDAPVNNVDAYIGTVSGLSISMSSATEMTTEGTSDISLARLDSTNFALAYSDNDDSENGTVRLLTIDGETISADSAIEFSGPIGDDLDIARLKDSRMAIVYRDSGAAAYTIVGRLPSDELDTLESSSSSTTNKRSTSLTRLRQQNGLDANGFPIASSSHSSSSSSSSSSSTSSSSVSSAASSVQSVVSSYSSEHPAAPESSMEVRTCTRVMKWFKGNTKMLERVNARLIKRFGFTC